MPETPRQIELRVLGGASLTGSGGAELHSVLAQPKRYALLVYLALAAPGRMQRRDSLLAMFWPESDEEHARGALRTSLHFLRRSLGDAVIETRGADEVGLAAGAIWCDALAFREAVQSERWEEAAELYGGPLLPGFGLEGAADWEDWLSAERASLARAAAASFEALARAREAAGDFAGAIEGWQRLAAAEPVQRRVALGLMRALARSGDTAGALEQARLFQQRLQREFEAGEDAEVAALAEELRSGWASAAPRPETRTQTPPLAAAPTGSPPAALATPAAQRPRPRFELPVPPTRLIGRDAQLTNVLGTLMQESVALLTLTGPGGIGKTRLALAVAREAQSHFVDGTYFIDLAPLAEPALVLPAIAEALGLAESVTPIAEVLRDHLASRALLLVLDNFEHVLDAAIELAPLLAASPRLKVLATSREPLHLRAEHEYPVPPLARYAAIDLFAARARAVRPTFELTEANAPTIAAICARLDGLPLAIELAAARIRLCSPHQILERLERSLGLLTDGARDLPTRQQTLRAAIRWSHDLLRSAEQTLFRRIAVFAGGCTFEALEAVCTAAADSSPGLAQPPELEVFDSVTSLLDKNLLVRREDGSDAARLGMLETIHEFARERLDDSGEAELLHRRHAEFFLALAESAEPRLQGGEQAQWLRRLDEEHDNFRAALRWLLDRGDTASLLRMSAALAPFWYLRSYRSEGRRWLCEALRTESGNLLAERAHALYGAARLVWQQDTDAARALTEECLALYRRLGESGRVGRALNLLGNLARQQGDLEQAEPLYRESLLVQREAGDNNGIAIALCNLGTIAQAREDYDHAAALYEESADLARSSGNRVLTGVLIGNLASVAIQRGDLSRTAALYREGLQVHWDVGYPYGIAWMLGNLAGVAGTEGSPQRAARLFGAAEALFATLGTHLEPVARSHYDRELSAARAQLAEAAWQRAWAEGEAMPLEEAIDYALQE